MGSSQEDVQRVWRLPHLEGSRLSYWLPRRLLRALFVNISFCRRRLVALGLPVPAECIAGATAEAIAAVWQVLGERVAAMVASYLLSLEGIYGIGIHHHKSEIVIDCALPSNPNPELEDSCPRCHSIP